MPTWTNDELIKIAAAEELEIAPRRSDGTLRNPVTIWVVRHGDDLYIRSVNGRTAAWFRGVQVRYEGHIHAGDVDKDVTFVDAAPGINDQLDAAYRYCEPPRRISESFAVQQGLRQALRQCAD